MPSPKGLKYYPNVLTEESEKILVEWIDHQKWNESLSRRTQHYGYEYNYRSRTAAKPTRAIEGPLYDLATSLQESEIMTPTQCIINEYTQNQNISAHIDALIFGPVVVSVSLLAPTLMLFTNGTEKFEIVLEPRSMVILTEDARYKWKHEIVKRQNFKLPDGTIYTKPSNYRRISLTYRTLANVST